MKEIFLAFFIGLFAGALLMSYERKWECDTLGHWSMASFAYACHRISQPTSADPKP